MHSHSGEIRYTINRSMISWGDFSKVYIKSSYFEIHCTVYFPHNTFSTNNTTYNKRGQFLHQILSILTLYNVLPWSVGERTLRKLQLHLEFWSNRKKVDQYYDNRRNRESNICDYYELLVPNCLKKERKKLTMIF